MSNKSKEYVWDNKGKSDDDLTTASLCIGEVYLIINAPSPKDSYWLMSCIHEGQYIIQDYSMSRNSQYLSSLQAKEEAIKVFKELVIGLQDNLNLLTE